MTEGNVATVVEAVESTTSEEREERIDDGEDEHALADRVQSIRLPPVVSLTGGVSVSV